jgi:hypothetical protein
MYTRALDLQGLLDAASEHASGATHD